MSTEDIAAVVALDDEGLAEIKRLLELGGRYHRRIQFTDWQTTTPAHLADCFAHALRESAIRNPTARFWWVETGEADAPLIVGYLGNGPSSELNAWLLGAGPSLVARLQNAEAALCTAAERLAELERLATEQAPQRTGTVDELLAGANQLWRVTVFGDCVQLWEGEDFAFDLELRKRPIVESIAAALNRGDGLERSLAAAQRELDDSERRRQWLEREWTAEKEAVQRVTQNWGEEARALRSRVQALEGALRDALKMCRCNGTGKYETNCSRCGDSTEDHECNDDTRDCTRPVCIAARAALAAQEGETR